MDAAVAPERLAGIELFSDMSETDLARISEIARPLQAPTGTVVIEEGDKLSAKFFVIIEGTVTVHRAGRHLADLGPGDFFGEAGTTALAPRNATVIATTPVKAAVIMGWHLRELLDELPALRAKLEALSAERKP